MDNSSENKPSIARRLANPFINYFKWWGDLLYRAADVDTIIATAKYTDRGLGQFVSDINGGSLDISPRFDPSLRHTDGAEEFARRIRRDGISDSLLDKKLLVTRLSAKIAFVWSLTLPIVGYMANFDHEITRYVWFTFALVALCVWFKASTLAYQVRTSKLCSGFFFVLQPYWWTEAFRFDGRIQSNKLGV